MVENDRVWLILIDHANWRRLKIWAWARIVHHNDDPALLARLEDPAYRAKVERAVLLRIEAFDWYCRNISRPSLPKPNSRSLLMHRPSAVDGNAIHVALLAGIIV